jgi:hypothetical protein
MKLARKVAWWPTCMIIAVGTTTTLLASTEVVRSAERDRASTASDRAERITGTGVAATTRKELRKKNQEKQQGKKKLVAPPQ